MPVGIMPVEYKGKTYQLTELQAKVVNSLIKAKDDVRVKRLLEQRALDVPEGLQVPPGGASNAPIRDQAPKPGEPGQPEKSPANLSSSVVDGRERPKKALSAEKAAEIAAAATANAEGAGGEIVEETASAEDSPDAPGEGPGPDTPTESKPEAANEEAPEPVAGEVDEEKKVKMDKLLDLQVS